MSVEEQALSSAGDVIRRSLPEAVYLFASFFQRKARKFHAISERGTLFARVTLTAALALICALAGYLVMLLDPFNGIEGIMGAYERAAWAALIPLIAVPPICWLLGRHSDKPIFSTFLNLGLVTSTALTVIPGIIILAGANASALAADIGKLRTGRAEGTPVHRVYCGGIERRAEIGAAMRDLNRIAAQLMRNTREIQANTRQLARNRVEVNAAGQEMLRARAAGEPEHAQVAALFAAMERGRGVMERGLAIQERSLEINRRNLDLIDRSIDLEMEQTKAPLRLFAGYPVATAFLAIGVFAGLMIWLFAGVNAWLLIVTPQPTRKRKILLGTSLVILFVTLWIGFGLLRSGFLEALIQETPSREMLLAQTKTQFEEAAPMCGKLNNYGLW